MISKIFLDLDGVVRDWCGGINKKWGVKVNQEAIQRWDYLTEYVMKEKGISEKFFWDDQDEDFWTGLEFYPEAKQIITMLEQTDRPVYILNSPTLTNAGYSQKWIRNKMPAFFNEKRYLIGPCKYAVASPDALLIDDAEKNIDPWIEHGGVGFLYPRPWNRMRRHANEGLFKLESFLYHAMRW